MPRSAAAFLIFFAPGCNREIDEHTHPLVEHEHSFADHTHADETADAVIVSIAPPLFDDRPLDHPLKSNGSLQPHGFQTITVIFSNRPQRLTVTNDDPAECGCSVSPVFEWTLQGRTLELKAFCGE